MLEHSPSLWVPLSFLRCSIGYGCCLRPMIHQRWSGLCLILGSLPSVPDKAGGGDSQGSAPLPLSIPPWLARFLAILRYGDETPSGTPSLRMSGYSQSGSPRRRARPEINSSCPSVTPVFSLICERRRAEKGCDLFPWWMEFVKSCTQGSQTAARSFARDGHGDFGRRWGGVLPQDGLPPPSRSGLVLKPSWTRTGLS